MPALARRFTVVAADPRGVNLSDRAAGGYDAGSLAADLVALMEALGRSRFALIGHDLGMTIGYGWPTPLPLPMMAFSSITVWVRTMQSPPRWRQEIEPAADCYLHAYKPGAFCKSWVVNVGVANSPFTSQCSCVLDSDILVDRDFVRRNVARLRSETHAAHLPFQWAFNLTESASSWAIQQRVLDNQPDASLEGLRGFLKRGSPGGCLWVRTDAFHQIAGFDERFEGWGGEDDDVDARLAQVGPFVRYDDPLLHLFHPRPTMTRDGTLLNVHIQQGSWPRNSPFGSLRRYADRG